MQNVLAAYIDRKIGMLSQMSSSLIDLNIKKKNSTIVRQFCKLRLSEVSCFSIPYWLEQVIFTPFFLYYTKYRIKWLLLKKVFFKPWMKFNKKFKKPSAYTHGQRERERKGDTPDIFYTSRQLLFKLLWNRSSSDNRLSTVL